MRHRAPIVISVIGILLTASAAALAFSSSDFQKEAAAYTSQHCKPKAVDNIALMCYLYAITQELAARPTPIKAYDANGAELGLVIGVGNNGATIYSSQLKEFLRIATNSYYENPSSGGGFFASGIGNVDQQLGTIYYQSNDCSGTPFASVANGFTSDSVLPFSPTEFYTYHPSDNTTTISANSQRQDSNSLIPCQQISSSYTAHVWPIYPITMPFQTPIAEPVQFK